MTTSNPDHIETYQPSRRGGDPAPTQRASQGSTPSRTGGLVRGFSLGRWLGVKVDVDASLFIIFALITFNLGAGVFPSWHPNWGAALTWGLAVGAALAFFLSVLLHELSHAVVARAQGMSVNRITLFVFGGLAHLEDEPPSAKAEFWMAIVGPITSVVLGIVGIAVGTWLAGPEFAQAADTGDPAAFAQAVQRVGPLATLALWLGPVNLVLGLFNVVPGFPLDGGRVFRSILWGITGDLEKATYWAAGVGRVVAWALMAWGVFSIFGGALGSGLWLILIGWFLNNAAKLSHERVVVQRVLSDVPVQRLMQTRFESVAPSLPLDGFVRDRLMRGEQRTFPVVSDQGELLGLIAFSDLRRHSQTEWPALSVADAMTPAEELTTVSDHATAHEAFEQLSSRNVNQLPIVREGRLVGLVSRSDLLKWIALQTNGTGFDRSAFSTG